MNPTVSNGTQLLQSFRASTARATEIIKLFNTGNALAPNRLAASGYGEYDLAASNETEEGRAMNRRVDLVILNSNVESGVPPPQRWSPKQVSRIRIA